MPSGGLKFLHRSDLRLEGAKAIGFVCQKNDSFRSIASVFLPVQTCATPAPNGPPSPNPKRARELPHPPAFAGEAFLEELERGWGHVAVVGERVAAGFGFEIALVGNAKCSELHL